MPSERPQKPTPTPQDTDSAPTADEALTGLRRDFPGHRIWRATRWDGRLGDWVASLHDPSAGVDPTVIRSSPKLLREALVHEAERAEVARAGTW